MINSRENNYQKIGFLHFKKAGGKGQFISLSAYKEDGHSIFRGDLNAWKNDFEKFIKEIGF